MLFVPSGEPPHKTASERDPIAPAALRLAWVRAAIAGNPRFAVDALEVERGGTSYSVETLRTLGEQIAPDLPVFVLGIDAFAEVGTWREPEALFTLANFAVITRPGRPAAAASHWLPARVQGAFELARDGRSARHRAREPGRGCSRSRRSTSRPPTSARGCAADARCGICCPKRSGRRYLQSRVYAA